MPNTSAPFGLDPIRYRDGKNYTGQCTRYYVPSSDGTALYKGDPVQLAGSADANGIPTVTRATAAGGNYFLGVVVGFEPDRQIPLTYRPASIGMYVLVADDPDLMFAIQEDAVGGALAVTDVGLNVDLIAGSGSTYTGLSGFLLDTSTKGTTATLQLKIEAIDALDIGSTYQKALVSANLHQRNNTTGI